MNFRIKSINFTVFIYHWNNIMTLENIDTIFDFLKNIKLPYSWWLEEFDMRKDIAPSFAFNGSITLEHIINQGSINCVGVINIIRRLLGLDIPGTNNPEYKYPGGTYIWFYTLNNLKYLEKFNPNISYPKGTLLICDYVDVNQQGHVAVIFETNIVKPLESTIIHSYPYDTELTENLVQPGLIIEELQISHNWIDNGFYTHICYPQHWLSNNFY